MKTIEDCQNFVDLYNGNKDNGKMTFSFNINSIERTFKIYDFNISLDEDRADRLLKAENKYIEKLKYPFCPCKVEHIEDNICPCKDCIEEIKENGYCICKMYFKLD